MREEGGVEGKQHYFLVAPEVISNVKLVLSVTFMSLAICPSHELIKFSLSLTDIFLSTDVNYYSELNMLMSHTRSSSQHALALRLENGACQEDFRVTVKRRHVNRGPPPLVLVAYGSHSILLSLNSLCHKKRWYSIKAKE